MAFPYAARTFIFNFLYLCFCCFSSFASALTAAMVSSAHYIIYACFRFFICCCNFHFILLVINVGSIVVIFTCYVPFIHFYDFVTFSHFLAFFFPAAAVVIVGSLVRVIFLMIYIRVLKYLCRSIYTFK